MKNTVVMVDDNDDMRDAFEQLFERTSLNVVCFANVMDATIYLKNPANISKIIAIVSDLMMGPTDGLDFLSYIKSKPELAAIDFYLLTGSTVVVFEPYLKSQVLKGVIEKPFDPKTLISLFTNTASNSNLTATNNSQKIAA